MNPQILILNDSYDLYALGFVSNIIDVTEYRTFQRDKLIENEYTLEVKNFNNFFSVDNPISIFSAIQWRYTTLRIINESGITIWDGVIEDIVRDQDKKIAKIISTSVLSKYSRENIAYESSDWETPASAAKNIMDNYSFTTYDNGTIQTTIDKLTAESCYVKVKIEQKDNLTLMSALEKLAEYACADCYMSKGVVYFRHWTAYTGGVSVSMDSGDMITAPIISSLIGEIINDYRIGYDNCGDIPATDSANGNIGSISRTRYGTRSLPEMKSDVNAQIKYKDLTSAVYIGESYMHRTHNNLETDPLPLTQIEFNIRYDFKSYIDLQTYFKMTLSDEGWVDKVFEIFKLQIKENEHKIYITAVEVDI